jgi:hypothetical protein
MKLRILNIMHIPSEEEMEKWLKDRNKKWYCEAYSVLFSYREVLQYYNEELEIWVDVEQETVYE